MERDTLNGEMKKQLAIELLDRFKDHIYYRHVVEYADVDEFKKMTEPRVSFNYKIIF